MIDYEKINKEYRKIYKDLDSDSGRTSPLLVQNKIPVAEGLPLHIRCFLMHRMLYQPNLETTITMDPNEFECTVSYYDRYEMPLIGRQITISFKEMATLWEISGIKNAETVSSGDINTTLPLLLEGYLLKTGYALQPIAVKKKGIFEVLWQLIRR